MDLSICIFFAFFCFFFAFSICFLFAFLLLFCFFPGKKAKKKSKIKAKQKQIEKATKMQMDKSIFPHFFTFFDVPLFSPFVLLPVFFGFEVLLFDFPCVFLFLLFFKFKKH